jgi:sarcosine oxidase subunit gamma
MPDLLRYRSALADKAASGGDTVRLEALPEGHLLHVMGATTAKEIEACLLAAGIKDSSARPCGYRQWFVAGHDRLSDGQIRALADAVAGRAFISDQSHGRIRIRIYGKRAANVLSKGTAVDLHPSSFPEGNSAMTLFGHISAQLTRTGTDDFELTVLRSFSETLYGELETLVLSETAEGH